MSTCVCFAQETLIYTPGDASNTLKLTYSWANDLENGNLRISNWIPVAFDISDDIAFGNADHNVVEVDVTYKDDFSGLFWISFIDLNGIHQLAGEKILSGETGEYITKKFTLYDAALQNDGQYGDFTVTYENADNSSSGDKLYISSVQATVKDMTTPLELSVTTEAVGNIFFDGDHKQFDIRVENPTDTLAEREFVFDVVDSEKTQSYGKEYRYYTVGAGETVTDRISLSFSRYGAFYLMVSMLDNEDNTVRTWEIPFSICVKNDELSYDVGINAYIENADVYVGAMDIMKNVGFGNMRHGYDWEEFQRSESYYSVPSSSQKIIDKANSLGMNVVLVHSGHNSILFGADYDDESKKDMYMPKTDEEREAFAEYVYQSLKQTQGKVDTIEIWNEPDLEWYNKWNRNRLSPEMYAKLMMTVYKRVKDDFKDVTICGVCSCEVPDYYVDFWTSQVFDADADDDGKADGFKWFDRISTHHYTKEWDKGTDCHVTMEDIDDYKDLAKEKGISTQFYHTEFGISSTTDISYSTQMSRLSQYLLSLRARHMGDKFFIYQFSNAGNSALMREANFGLTETEWNEDVPFAAKPALIAISNMNNLLCGYDGVEVVRQVGMYYQECVYKFTNSDTGRIVYALYSPNGSQYTLKPEKENVVFYDVYGNYMNIDKNLDGSYTLPLTEAPIYAVLDANLVPVDNTANEVFISDEDVLTRYETDDETGITTAVIRFPNAKEGEAVGVRIFDEDGNLVQLQQLYTDRDGKITAFFYEEEGKDYTLWFGTKTIEGIYITGRNGMDGASVFISTDDKDVVSSLDEVKSNRKIRINASVNVNSSPDFKVFCATYNKDGSISKVDIFDIENMSYDKDVNLFYKDIDSAAYDDADSVKIFLWNSYSTIIPLTRKLELK